MNNFSILINTCDKFEDCWDPFFKLFKNFWPDFHGKIYLNTEYKDYSYPGLDIIAVKGCERNGFPKNKRATWSQCLIWALNIIDTDIILYMQEDYFIKDSVKNSIVDDFVDLMQKNPIDCIHLTDQSVLSDNEMPIYKDLKKVKLNQRYRVSCQAALWRKQTLIEHIRVYESAWQFEEFGSKRSAIMKHNFYVVNSNLVRLNHYEIIPYIFTGIVQGRWYEKVVPLFEKHNIEIDFGIRGFLNDAPKRRISEKIKNKIQRLPIILKHYKDIKKLKKQNYA